MTESTPIDLASIDTLRSYSLDAIIDEAREYFDIDLVLKVTNHNGHLKAELRPSHESIDMDDLNKLSLDRQLGFLSQTRKMHFGATPEGVPNNGILIAGDVLQNLPNHSVLRAQNCQITIETNCDELRVGNFDTGLYRILQALANMKPSNHVQDLPIALKYYNRDADCWGIKITGITGFDVKLRIFPNEGRRRPFTPSEWRAIGQLKIDLCDRIPKRPKSSKSPFATLPVEMVQAIIKDFVPMYLEFHIPMVEAKPLVEESDSGTSTLTDCSSELRVNRKLTFLQVDKRLREIALDIISRRAEVRLYLRFRVWDSDGFKHSLRYIQPHLDSSLLKRLRFMACEIYLRNDKVTQSRTYLPSGDTIWTWAVTLGAESKTKLRSIWHLLTLRPPASVPTHTLVTTGSYARGPCFTNFYGTCWIAVDIDSMRIGLNIHFIYALPDSWYKVSDSDVDDIVKACCKAVDAVVAPIVEGLTGKPYASGQAGEIRRI